MFLSDRWVTTNVLGEGVMRTFSLRTLGFLSVFQVFSSAGAIAQERHQDFFKGKTIQLSVGFAAGGGYDSYARMIAPFIAREIGSTVIVVNQPGAGGIASLNDMARATPDGLRMSLVNGWSNGLSQVLGVDGVRYDLAKFGMLGTISASPSVWIVGTRAKLTTIDHVRASSTPVNWAVTSVDDGLYVGAAITCFSLKLNCKFVPGYRGTNDGFLSVARGETDMIYLGDTSASNYVKAGDVIALATMSRKRSSLFPNLPTIFEYGGLSSDAEWFTDFHAIVESLGRILVVPPEMEPGRLEYLRNAAARALSDPQLIADGQKSGRYIQFISGGDTQAAVHQTIGSLSDADRNKFKAVIAATVK